MHIFRLLKAGSKTDFRNILIVTCLAGLVNAALLGIINQAAEEAALSHPIATNTLLLYVCFFAIFFFSDRASLRESNRLVQHQLEKLRLRIVSHVRRMDMRALEQLDQGDLYAIVAQEINHLSENLPLLVSAAQSVFLLAFCLLYIATLSFVSFLVISGIMAVGLFLYWLRRRKLDQALADVHRYEAAMLDNLTHFTKGFQEIRLNAAKNDALFRHFTHIIDNLRSHVVGVGGNWVVLIQFSNALLYVLVGAVIFVLPIFFQGYTDVIYKITAATIFCVGPLTAITSAASLYAKADIGLGHVARLERQLKSAGAAEQSATPSRFRNFETINLRNLSFSYRDAQGDVLFASGPLNMCIQRGETIFFVGGNGSGKSTVMKQICGLYVPDAGGIDVDGFAIGDDVRQEYRELFSAVFSDFHLFDRLHGIDFVDPAKAEALIHRMGLDGKVGFKNGRFSTTSLSTGQRKRLAMIASLLEDREIYIFDEWAADQDAHFRDNFYTELLPELKRQGKTVLAVTHDDRYWHCCDRRLTMDLGSIISETRGG
jgi:putative ATP-binding cassette transporter